MSAKPTREVRVGPEPAALWIFGYGSLVWRPEFAHLERRAAWVEGWTRRFWQGSTDHRGIPGAPGRVVTLVPGAQSSETRCWGTAYRIAPDRASRVLSALDHREKGGYQRVAVRLSFCEVRHERDVRDGRAAASECGNARALMYVATSSNPNYLGPAPLEAIARQVLASRGPSGTNLEYVQRLAAALLEICPDLGEQDEDVLTLARLLEAAPGAATESEGAGS